jgi:hypothetical protein
VPVCLLLLTFRNNLNYTLLHLRGDTCLAVMVYSDMMSQKKDGEKSYG